MIALRSKTGVVTMLATSVTLLSACHQPECLLEDTWRTVDAFNPNPTSPIPNPNDAASSDVATYVVGHHSFAGPRWTVRRSLDRGESWATVDDFRLPGSEGSAAGGVAVDPRTQHVYVVGVGDKRSGENRRGWVVRRSTDHGVTWSTVDDADGGHAALRVTVDQRSVIYVVGDWRGAGGFLRRSIDGGRTWRTVVYSSEVSTTGHGVATSRTGRVFVLGRTESEWIVSTSPNGLNSWEIVHRIPISPTDFSRMDEIRVSDSGRIVISGSVGGRGIIQESTLTNPRVWRTLDDESGWLPIALTFSRDQRIFAAGRGPGIDLSLSRIQNREETASGAFRVTDTFLVGGQTEGVDINMRGGGATTTAFGDILTAQWVESPGEDGIGASGWVVRKLGCRTVATEGLNEPPH